MLTAPQFLYPHIHRRVPAITFHLIPCRSSPIRALLIPLLKTKQLVKRIINSVLQAHILSTILMHSKYPDDKLLDLHHGNNYVNLFWVLHGNQSLVTFSKPPLSLWQTVLYQYQCIPRIYLPQATG